MTGALLAEPLTAAAFRSFGDVIEAGGAPDMLINEGLCGRFHDRARLDFTDGRAGLSLFDAEARSCRTIRSRLEPPSPPAAFERRVRA